MPPLFFATERLAAKMNAFEDIIMAISIAKLTQQLHEEIEQTPAEYRPLLLKIVHSFREGVTGEMALPSATESFRQGWQDVKAGRVHPIETLWDGVDAD